MTFESEYKPAHLVQSLAQASVYFYVALFWDGIREQAPYILLQLVFAHLFYFALTYWRERKIRYGLSMFPIVLSINLFIWFYPRYFIFHLLMVAAAILAKTYLVRERNGRIGHIFNPSGLVMAAAAVLVILGNWDYAIRTNELLSAYVRTPHILLWVFAAGCFSQWAGKVQPEEVVEVDWEGTPRLVPKTILLSQVLNHAGEHREQIKAIMTQIGVEPPDLQAWEYFDYNYEFEHP